MPRILLLITLFLQFACTEDEYEAMPTTYNRDSSIALLKAGFRTNLFDSTALLNVYEFVHRAGLQVFFWEDTSKAIARHLSIINGKVVVDEKLLMQKNGEMISTVDSAHYKLQRDRLDCWLSQSGYTDCSGMDLGNPVNIYYNESATHILIAPSSTP